MYVGLERWEAEELHKAKVVASDDGRRVLRHVGAVHVCLLHALRRGPHALHLRPQHGRPRGPHNVRRVHRLARHSASGGHVVRCVHN